MEFQLLGPFEARHEGQRVLVGSRRQERCLLSILLLHAGRVVTTARLIDLLWHGDAPASARGTVHTYIGRLRAGLSPYGLHLETRHDGYCVEPGTHEIDAQEFGRLLQQAAAAANAAYRLRLYDQALGLWRGPLLADVADDAVRDWLGGRLEDLRLSAVEQRADTQLVLGLHDRVVADLTPLAPLHPERERLVAGQMTALYRSGRQVDALRLYRRTRQALVSELGIEPGTELATLHDRILRADPRLDRPPVPVHAVRVGDEWLPWSTSGHPALEFCNTYAGWGGAPGGTTASAAGGRPPPPVCGCPCGRSPAAPRICWPIRGASRSVPVPARGAGGCSPMRAGAADGAVSPPAAMGHPCAE